MQKTANCSGFKVVTFLAAFGSCSVAMWFALVEVFVRAMLKWIVSQFRIGGDEDDERRIPVDIIDRHVFIIHLDS